MNTRDTTLSLPYGTGLSRLAGNFKRPGTARRLVIDRLKHIQCGTLHVHLPNGECESIFGEPAPGLEAHLEIKHDSALRQMLFGGAVGFAEGYIDGHWDTPDLSALLHLLHRNESTLRAGKFGSCFARIANRLYHKSRKNSRSGSRRNITYHYDLGNDFYSRWLDGSMTYSSALFENRGHSLEQAQTLKYQRIAELAGLHPGGEVLEVGCGWGGFMTRAVTDHDCNVDGITLSQEQLAWTNSRMEDLGISHRARASLTDYRDTRGQYDAVVSIEMMEAVGEEHWQDYFNMLHDRLKPGAAHHRFRALRALQAPCRFYPALHIPGRHAANHDDHRRTGSKRRTGA
jgi:cyclopropane-fatty-acyl-phospholipid synthase